MKRQLVLFLAVAAVVGCGKKPKPADAPAPAALTQAPPPMDSGADRAPGAAKPGLLKNWDGPGYPDRLLVTIQKVVRGTTEVRVEAAGDYFFGDDFVIAVSVKTQGTGGPLDFTSWRDAGKVVLKDHTGKSVARRPLDPLQEDELRRFTESRPGVKAGYGSGPVTPDRQRMTFLAFDRAAKSADHLDLDLDGTAIGTTDPILFRIPNDFWAKKKG